MKYFLNVLKYGNARALRPIVIVVSSLLIITGFLDIISIPLLIPVIEIVLGVNKAADSPILIKINHLTSYFGFTLSLTIMVVLVISVIIISFVLKYVNSVLLTYIRRKVIISFRLKLMEVFYESNWTKVLKSRSGELINLFVEKCPFAGDTYFFILQGVTAFFYSLVYAGIGIYVSWKLSIILFFSFTFLTLINWLSVKLIRKQNVLNVKYSNLLAADLFDQMRAIKFIFSSSLQESNLIKTSKFNDYSLKHEFNSRILVNANNFLNQLLGFLIIMLIASTSRHFGVTLVEIAVFLYIVKQLFPQIQYILKAYQVWIGHKPQLEVIFHNIEGYKSHRTVDGHYVIKHNEEIRFDRVSFTYDNNEPIFSDLSLTIAKNKTTAIVGVSGSGKTTIVDLLMGLLEPREGKLMFGTHALSEINKKELHKKIGYVSQESVLFNGTIKDNIIIRKPDATDKEISEVLKMTALDKFISSLPEGFNTQIGENGIRLSGGQRQRIALTRALIIKPQFLILDEATSSLDVESEAAIQSAIDNIHGSLTILIIAHRLSTVRLADVIHLISHGEVVESGTYGELLVLKGSFYRFDQISSKSTV